MGIQSVLNLLGLTLSPIKESGFVIYSKTPRSHDENPCVQRLILEEGEECIMFEKYEGFCFAAHIFRDGNKISVVFYSRGGNVVDENSKIMGIPVLRCLHERCQLEPLLRFLKSKIVDNGYEHYTVFGEIIGYYENEGGKRWYAHKDGHYDQKATFIPFATSDNKIGGINMIPESDREHLLENKISTARILFRGAYSENIARDRMENTKSKPLFIRSIHKDDKTGNGIEGVIIRSLDGKKVMKYKRSPQEMKERKKYRQNENPKKTKKKSRRQPKKNLSDEKKNGESKADTIERKIKEKIGTYPPTSKPTSKMIGKIVSALNMYNGFNAKGVKGMYYAIPNRENKDVIIRHISEHLAQHLS